MAQGGDAFALIGREEELAGVGTRGTGLCRLQPHLEGGLEETEFMQFLHDGGSQSVCGLSPGFGERLGRNLVGLRCGGLLFAQASQFGGAGGGTLQPRAQTLGGLQDILQGGAVAALELLDEFNALVHLVKRLLVEFHPRCVVLQFTGEGGALLGEEIQPVQETAGILRVEFGEFLGGTNPGDERLDHRLVALRESLRELSRQFAASCGVGGETVALQKRFLFVGSQMRLVDFLELMCQKREFLGGQPLRKEFLEFSVRLRQMRPAFGDFRNLRLESAIQV